MKNGRRKKRNGQGVGAAGANPSETVDFSENSKSTQRKEGCREMVELSPDELELFVSEAEENINGLENGLLRLEQEGDTSLVAELFRHAHTLKGSAGAAGLTEMSQLGHAMENLLDQVRNGERKVTSDLIDTLLEGVDMLRAMVFSLRQNEPLPNPSPLINQLNAIAERKSLEPESKPAVETSSPSGEVTATLNIFIKPECPMPAARAFQAYLAMSRYGEIVSLEPPVSEIQAGRAKYRLVAQLKFPDGASLNELESELTRFEDLVVEVQRQQDGRKVSEIVTAQKEKEVETTTTTAAELQSVRVSIEQMDALLNLVGELVIERARLERGVRKIAELNANGVAEELQGVTERVSRIVGQLQESLTRTRMVPLSVVFGRFPRLVRELARNMGKKVQLSIEGEDTEIDRALVEKLNECLVHLVRNAIDHGIESPEERIAVGKPAEGLLEISASQSEGSVIVVVRDDGRGIDPNKIRRKAIERGLLTEEQAANLSDDEALQLIFRSGFSTKEEVSEVSGRGVGMDAVKAAMEQIGGAIDFHSQVGEGTTVTLRLPLTLAIIPALLVRIGGRLFALPMHSVTEVLDLTRSDIQVIGQGEKVLMLRGNPLPLCSLSHLLGVRNGLAEKTAVIVRQRERLMAVSVEGVEGKDEIVIKPLGYPLHNLRSFIGATILGDGSIALIVDLNGLAIRR
ncbi:MAG: chemotaxis protein CheA [Armatimonadetes bacterium]|nr:chemotaxis protein CheA [Armatimonadota bacterium]MCX7968664.1 chemotaxis protein CheA [Armatimonadota bacterium]MDW8143404.1 chemotaxis protein CheA [Armatimonadota bacterium]